MATIGVVDANEPDTVERTETQKIPRKLYFGVFFDGTSNNMVDKAAAEKFRASSKSKEEWEPEVRSEEDESFRNGANQLKTDDSAKYSNVAILHSTYAAMSEKQLNQIGSSCYVKVFNIYVEGAGTDAIYEGSMTEKVYNWKGSISGKGHSGVLQLVSKAVNMIRLRLKGYSEEEMNLTEVHFDVYGFSRGATCARMFSFLAVRETGESLPCESDFKSSLAASHYSSGFLHFTDDLHLKSVSVDFLGIYDTVSSIGGISTSSYAKNVTDYGLYSPTLPKVKSTFHLCAMDEYREHFALTDIGKINSDSAELFIPGCHSDVGGGYVDNDDCDFTLEIGCFDITKSRFYGKPSYVRKSYLSNKIEAEGQRVELGEEAFLHMGWIDNEKQYWERFDGSKLLASVKRKVQCGYSNIPLEMMHTRSKQKTSREVFKDIPLRYKVDKKYKEWYSFLIDKVSESGRQWCYPGGSYTSESYQKLRKYLHFSSNNSIGLTPSFDKSLLSRYLYHGEKGVATRYFVYNAY